MTLEEDFKDSPGGPPPPMNDNKKLVTFHPPLK